MRLTCLLMYCSLAVYGQTISGTVVLSAKTSLAPPTSTDCTVPACAELNPHDSSLNLTFDPYVTTGGFAGYADPSIRKDPQTGTLWLAYSYTITKPGQTHVIETHIAYSVDSGATWTNSGLTHSGIVNPTTQVCNATTHPSGCSVASDYDWTAFEVTNLLPVVSGGTTYWFMTGQSYQVPYGCATNCGTTRQPYTVRLYLVNAAGTAGQGPMSLYGATPYYMGSSDNTDPNFPIDADFSALAGSNCTATPWREPSMNTNGTTSDMYFNTSCGDLSNILQFHTLISFPTPTISFSYVNKFANASDAAGICAYVDGCAYTSPNRLRFTQSDQVTCQSGASTCMVASVVHIDNSGNKIGLGCVMIPLTTVTPPVLSTSGGHANVISTVQSTDSVTQGAGSCTYEPSNIGGITIAHKVTNCAGLSTNGCGTQNGLFTYLMDSKVPAPTPQSLSSIYCPAASTGLPALPAGVVQPALPNSCTVPNFPVPLGSTVAVATAGDLQTALTSASCGQWIQLANGVSFQGNFTVPGLACPASNPVLVAQANVSSLTQFVPPSQALAGTSGMATLKSNNSSATLIISDNAAGWYFAGLEFTLTAAATNIHPIVAMGELTTTAAALPRDITFDRVLIHPAPCVSDSIGSPCHYVARGIDLNAVNGTLMFSQVYGIVNAGQDAQDINIANSTGPGMILGNYLEATGENIIFNTSCTIVTATGNAPSGAPWGSTGWVAGDDGMHDCPAPADYTIRLNHTKKLLAWQTLPSGCVFASNNCYDVKNHWEIKHGQRILWDSNIADTSFAAGQAVMFIDNCFAAGIYICQDITYTNNLWVHGPNIGSVSGNGWAVTGGTAITTGTRTMMRNNVALDINGISYGSADCVHSAPYTNCSGATTFQAQHSYNITVDHNTSINRPSQVQNGINFTDFGPDTDFGYVLRNNLQWGSPFANGKNPGGTIATFPSPTFGGDVFVGDYWGYPTIFGITNTPVYPSGIQSFSSPAVSVAGTPPITCQNNNNVIQSCWPLDWALVNMADFANASVGNSVAGAALTSASPFYRAGTDGMDVGANIPAVVNALSAITW